MARHLRATASPFLPHLEPKSKLSSRPCPPCPQPARALDRQTSPAYPAPTLSSQSPKATQPTRLGPIRPGGCIRGQARPGARMFAGTGPFPACRRGDGRAGRWNWCWLTGYIFDTFNELVQTFHEEGLARVTAALLWSLLPVPEACAGQGSGPTIRRTGGWGSGTVPSPLPSLGRMDLMRILWPLSVHGVVLSFTHVVPIKKQIYSSYKVSTLLLTGQQATGNHKSSLKSALSSEH